MQTKEPDLLLWTDGSGHQDGFGGYAAFVRTSDNLVRHFCMGSASDSSVDRMEFTALIEGLRMCIEMWQRFPNSYDNPMSDCPTMKKPRIRWYSDRESLIMSVKKVYSRENCPDLWAAFEVYEKMIHLEPVFMAEAVAEASEEFTEVDLQSSTGRLMMRDYYRNTPLRVDETLMKEHKKKKEKPTT